MKNIFDTPEGKDALARMDVYDKANIRYSLVEQYGIERILKDLRARSKSPCDAKICYESHRPMDIIKYFYCGNDTLTVRIPIMPTVIIEKVKTS